MVKKPKIKIVPLKICKKIESVMCCFIHYGMFFWKGISIII